MRMRVSIFMPKAFSMRSAMSPDRLAFRLSKLDSVGRETRSAAAAAVTERPAGAMISVRIKSPGCGGFFMGIKCSFCVSDNLPSLGPIPRFRLNRFENVKRRLPVTLRLQVPLRSPVSRCAFQLANGRNSSAACVSSRNASILRNLSIASGRDTSRIVFRVKPPETLVREAANLHVAQV